MFRIKSYGSDGQGSITGIKSAADALRWFREAQRMWPDRAVILMRGDVIVPISDIELMEAI